MALRSNGPTIVVRHIRSDVVTCSFDQFVRDREERGGEFKTDSLGGAAVDHELIFRWVLYREVCRLLVLENAIDIRGGATEHIKVVGAIGHEAAAVGEKSEHAYRRNAMPPRQRNNQLKIRVDCGVRRYPHGAIRLACEFLNCTLDLGGVAHRHRREIKSEQ